VKYTKPALSFGQQAQRLVDRGLIVSDQAELVARLRTVNYYRLSAYWYPFMQETLAGERFVPGTTFEMIWRRYIFDRDLRLLVTDALERVEVAVLRTRMVELFTLAHGPFGYVNRANFNPGFSAADHARLLTDLAAAVAKSKEEFVSRFNAKYTQESQLPLWMAAELMTFGQLFTLFRNLNRVEQQALARPFGVFPPVLVSWLHCLNFTRNVCAHHLRLWNRELPIRPLIPDKRHRPDWHRPVTIRNDRVFAMLSVLRHMLREIEPQSNWQARLESLLGLFPDIPLSMMGFADNWQAGPIWKK
jgi:abortive infection bacteriophage resistance protein